LSIAFHDYQALQKAWGVACSTPKSVLLIPQDRRYLVNATRFKGPCADKLIIQVIKHKYIDLTIVL